MSEVNDAPSAVPDPGTCRRDEGKATVPFRPVNAPPVPKRLAPELAHHPRYRVVELLGEGGMGTVYQAEHRIMKRRVALKVINSRLVDSPIAVERFRREVQAAALLSHPNIVIAHDAECVGDIHFLVMELVDGVSLDRLVARKGALPVAHACDYARQAALGLQHAHEHGMVHRDIKPQNLMLTPEGQVKILDFGLARFASENNLIGLLTESGAMAGTPDYIAPEQAEDARQADIRADIYSLGCTLYFLLTGQPPFPHGSAFQKFLAHHKQAPRPLTEFRDDLPSGLLAVFERMTAKDPAGRYQTPAEVDRALQLIPSEAGGLSGSEAATRKNSSPAPLRASDSESSGEGAGPFGETDPVRSHAGNSAEAPAKTAADTENRSRSRTISKRRSSDRPRKVVALCLAFGFLLLAGVGGLIALTSFWPQPLPEPIQGAAADQAEVFFRSEVPEAEVVVRLHGQVIQTLQPGSGQWLVLPPGEYDLQLAGEVPGYRLSSKRLVLCPGDRRCVDVQPDGPRRPARPRFPPPHPGLPPPHPGFPPPHPGFPPPRPGEGQRPPPDRPPP
jgi:serine/threonine protein kinase